MTTPPARRRVATLGETMALARSRDIGSLRHASDLVLGIGGAESNVAIALSRLGLDAAWLGRVGDDPLGERVVREVRAEGVDVLAIVDSGAPTGLMLKERPRPSSMRVLYYRAGSAGSRLSPADVPDGWIERADLLHLTGITALLSESAREALSVAIERARSAGATVAFDINYRSSLAAPALAGPWLRDLAERADVVFGGPEEFELLYPGTDGVAACERLLRSGPTEAVLKRGADGATTVLRTGAVASPGFVVDVVDTVGAGDAFVAGYLSALLEGADVEARLHRANVCGAMLCMTPGDWESSPTLREVEQFTASAGDPVLR
ncbi:sugar kinase [Leifsonia sp. F6_8S_P_1B]|uniref:Sugar kinase n=1 Tax=Leifsonia williamsii TaxID=3035919 RepID=A0ABT8KJ41_9MICO|nr:sugar kinase [Leifsonia williamsii]MDN4616334.1 sugar kinase [Leifsonia williamsii]